MLSINGTSLAYKRALSGEKFDPEEPAEKLLVSAGFLNPDGSRPKTDVGVNWRMRLLSFLERFENVFVMRGPSVGGVNLVGGVIRSAEFGLSNAYDDVISAGGRGFSLGQALDGCIYEAAERLSLLDPAQRDAGDEITGINLVTDELVTRSRDAVFRRKSDGEANAAAPSSAGCASGRTFQAALASALLELAERDAVALWWFGGRPAAPVPRQRDALAACFPLQPADGRRRWLLDLTCETGVSVIAAVSSTNTGEGVVVGAAADWRSDRAAHRAALELAQMEVGASLALTKSRLLGEGDLTSGDRLWLERLKKHSVAAYPCFEPAGDARRTSRPAVASVKQAIAHWDKWAENPVAFDITAAVIGIPCVRLSVTGLQSLQLDVVTPRLRRLLDKHPNAEAINPRSPAPI